MNKNMSIESFQNFLNSEENTGDLHAAISKLTEIEDPRNLSVAIKIGDSQPIGGWGGWAF